jgi:serine/threonine protein kinase
MLRDDAEARDEVASAADASLVRRVGPAVVPAIARYRLLERIAAGSMGVVYRARDRHLGRDVALKVLRLESRQRRTRRDEATARARFLQEARAMARIDHPNVVPIYGIETAGDHLVIAMEYVAGRTLAEWLQTPRTWREVVRVMVAAGEGLAAAHAAGAIHRDFKPHNVLVGDDRRPRGAHANVRVTDFGLALVREEPDEITEDDEMFEVWSGEPTESLTQTGMSVGTPAYMAPEQHVGRSMDPRSDQYGFCATLYEALHGTRPFRGRDNVELASAKRRMRLAKPLRGTSGAEKVPGWLAAAVRRGLSPFPDDRFEDMHALLRAMQGPSKRRTPLFAAMAGTLVGVLAGGTLAFVDLSGDASGRERAELAVDALAEAPPSSTDAELARCRRTLAAGRTTDAEMHCARAYFTAVERGAFAHASEAADLLAAIRERAGAPGEAAQWRRHAAAARRRGQ